MSDAEEPPQKVTKLEQEADAEMMDEGQEEWLSEEVYTDDDYTQPAGPTQAAASTADQETTPNTSQESQSLTGSKLDTTQETTQGGNIEETLNTLDGNKEVTILDGLLIRKTDTKAVGPNIKEEVKVEKDDGNDTDYLLRMLGEEETKAKKKLLKVKDRKPGAKPGHSSDDDDSFVYEGVKVTRLKVAKNALMNKMASKAVPEDTSDGDDESEQSDEAVTVQRMFTVKRANVAAKSTTKPATATVVQTNKQTVKHATPLNKHNTNKRDKPTSNQTKSILKPMTPKVDINKKPSVSFKAASNIETSKLESVLKSGSKLKPDSAKIDFDETSNIDEEEFLDDDEFDLDEEQFADGSDIDVSGVKQRLPRPERMEEEVPSDGDSHSEDGSLYDELPSSDSDEMEDWFTIDIRAERAGDYLPLLGSKAFELLSDEKKRVAERLATLRDSLTSLTESGRKQADELREATMSLAELDDMLKAS